MRDRGLIALASCMAVLGQSGSHAQAPLSLDTGFRADIPSQNVYSILPLPDGKVIISGRLDFPGLPTMRSGARLLPNGERDLTFNQGFLPMGGKLVQWGDRFYCANGPGGIRRFNMDGTLDNAFNFVDQWQQISALNPGDYHVYPDGRVLLGGYYDIIDPAHGYYQGVGYNLAWITNEGRLDTTRTHRTGNGTVWKIKEYPAGTAGGLGGRFLIHHWGTTYEGQPVSKVFRIHADGSLDESFNAPIPWGYVYDMLPLPDGLAYIAGEFHLENGTDRVQLVRLLPDGSLDPSFNNGLAFEIDTAHLATYPSVMDVFELGSGLLALAGDFNAVDGHTRGGLCIIDTTGQVVPFYADGAMCGNYDYQMGLQTVTYGALSGITRAPNGQYYIYGAYHGYNDGTTNDTLQRMVTRLHGGAIGLGVAEQRPAVPAMRVYPNPASTSLTLELEEVPRHAELVLKDALGRAVLSQRVSAHFTYIDLTRLSDEVFHLELIRHGERIATQRLVVQP